MEDRDGRSSREREIGRGIRQTPKLLVRIILSNNGPGLCNIPSLLLTHPPISHRPLLEVLTSPGNSKIREKQLLSFGRGKRENFSIHHLGIRQRFWWSKKLTKLKKTRRESYLKTCLSLRLVGSLLSPSGWGLSHLYIPTSCPELGSRFTWLTEIR